MHGRRGCGRQGRQRAEVHSCRGFKLIERHKQRLVGPGRQPSSKHSTVGPRALKFSDSPLIPRPSCPWAAAAARPVPWPPNEHPLLCTDCTAHCPGESETEQALLQVASRAACEATIAENVASDISLGTSMPLALKLHAQRTRGPQMADSGFSVTIKCACACGVLSAAQCRPWRAAVASRVLPTGELNLAGPALSP